jgi:hypothetical protein
VPSTKPFFHASFFQEPAGTFVLGHPLKSAALEVDLERYVRDEDVGFWQCDLTKHDALTWSDKVYEIFGLPHGSEVVRGDVVAKYREHSRGVLERMRTYAIKRKCGFILDAAINPHGTTRWIRILAAPIVEEDRVVGLHGLKRQLKPELR